MSPSFRATSQVSGLREARCAPITTGSTRAPRLSTFETVTSRTPRSRSASSVPERRSAGKRSPCPGAYSDGFPSASRKSSPDGSSRSDTNWLKTSGSPRRALGDVLADRRIGREARHQRDRDGDPDLALEGRRLEELRLEEAPPVDRFEDRLDDAAEASGHPAGQHDLRDLATSQCVETGLARRLVVGIARGRKRA